MQPYISPDRATESCVHHGIVSYLVNVHLDQEREVGKCHMRCTRSNVVPEPVELLTNGLHIGHVMSKQNREDTTHGISQYIPYSVPAHSLELGARDESMWSTCASSHGKSVAR